MISGTMQEAAKRNIARIIDALVEIICKPDKLLKNSPFYTHEKERKQFIIYLYLYKLMLNKENILTLKYNSYCSRIKNRKENDCTKFSNIAAETEVELLLKIKRKLPREVYYYNEKDESIYFNDDTWVDMKWLLPLLALLLDKTKKNSLKEVNICYTIPKKEISPLEKEQIDNYLEQFTYYNIFIKQKEANASISENSILIIKNAAINYLKHLKRYKHGLETEESYQIFYNLLTKECSKQGFVLEEKKSMLNQVNENFLEKIKAVMDDAFYTLPESKQCRRIENAVWQWSNDLNLLEQTNTAIDSLLDLIASLNMAFDSTYSNLKDTSNFKDIDLLLILLTAKFLLVYTKNDEKMDYSRLQLKGIKPKYMSNICSFEEQDICSRMNTYLIELQEKKKSMDRYKEERAKLNKVVLGRDKYQSELERCVGNINRTSITIATLNSKLASLNKRYEEIKEERKSKFHDIDLYNYNNSIIEHICNSILGCSFYLKTNNHSSLLNNVIVFEDYEKTDSSFYLELTMSSLLEISNPCLLNSLEEQMDLPKLA